MEFSTPKAVLDTLRASDDVEKIRGENRAKVNDLFNGVPPLTVGEAKKMNLKVNCNFGEAASLAANARRQFTNAFMRPGRFFKVSLPTAPAEYKTRWEQFITTFINRCMKTSRQYYHLFQNKISSVVSHGIAPQLWCDPYSWLPYYIAVEDLRVPTDTEISFQKLEWFAVRHHYTEGELTDVVYGKHADKSWNKQAISRILKNYHTKNYETELYDWQTNPEKMAELVKQNLGFYCSDAVPTIPLWKFYYKDRDKNRNAQWKLCVVPDLGVRGEQDAEAEFLAKKDTWASELSHILHVQFGDLNNKAPHMYHSVRSLGFLLMEPCFWSNMLSCRSLQHVFESFNIWLRISDPAGRQRTQKVELFDQCVVPEGVTVVPQNERHQIDPNIVEAVRSNMRQFMNEASASYVQSPDTGTSREQTAYETAVKMSQINAMMGGLLMTAFFQETFAYREICRRFCLKNTWDEDALEFQKEAKRLKIPNHILNVKHWDVTPEIPLGAGNPTMEMAQAGQLMQQREKFNPAAQQEILHDFVSALSNDPSKADRLAPLDDQMEVSSATRDSESVFGSLMQGVPVHDRVELNPIDQIEALLGMYGTAISQALKTGGMATQQQIAGFSAVSQHLDRLLQRLATNPLERQRVKQYADIKGKLDNEVKGFAQRLQEQMQKQAHEQQNGNGAETIAKVQAMLAQAEAKLKAQEAKTAQKLQHDAARFQADEARKNATTAGDISRKNMLAEVDAETKRMNAQNNETGE